MGRVLRDGVPRRAFPGPRHRHVPGEPAVHSATHLGDAVPGSGQLWEHRTEVAVTPPAPDPTPTGEPVERVRQGMHMILDGLFDLAVDRLRPSAEKK